MRRQAIKKNDKVYVTKGFVNVGSVGIAKEYYYGKNSEGKNEKIWLVVFEFMSDGQKWIWNSNLLKIT